MTKKRDTVTYDLKVGNQIVYRGTTNDPEAREKQHQSDGKKFTHMHITSRKMTEEGALKKETQSLERYRSGHGGENPKYNVKKDG